MKDKKRCQYIGYILIGIGILLLIAGSIICYLGSKSFNNYYVERITLENYYSSFVNFISISIKYSKMFYLGIGIILLSALSFLISIVLFVYYFEIYTNKDASLEIVLKKINPEGKSIASVNVGAKYENKKE